MDEIVIDGVIGGWDVTSQEFIAELNAKKGDVLIKINSVGGSVMHGVAIFNAIKAYNKGNVTAQITGVAASIASYIVLACDTVEAYDNTTYMIHNASLCICGDYKELVKAADISEGLSAIIAKAYISKTSMSDKDIRKLMDDETFYYGAEMLDAGFVDNIISTDSGATNKKEALAMASERLKACNNAIIENESNLSLESVAKLLPEKEEVIVEVINEVVDVSAQQKRERDLFILKQGMN